MSDKTKTTLDLTNDIREIMQAAANYRANAMSNETPIVPSGTFTTRPEHMTQTEFGIVSDIVRRAISKGYTVSINDDAFGHGEWTVKRSREPAEIIEALATTGGDLLKFRDATGKFLGVVSLIYGNGEDVVSDCSDAPAILELI